MEWPLDFGNLWQGRVGAGPNFQTTTCQQWHVEQTVRGWLETLTYIHMCNRPRRHGSKLNWFIDALEWSMVLNNFRVLKGHSHVGLNMANTCHWSKVPKQSAIDNGMLSKRFGDSLGHQFLFICAPDKRAWVQIKLVYKYVRMEYGFQQFQNVKR